MCRIDRIGKVEKNRSNEIVESLRKRINDYSGKICTREYIEREVLPENHLINKINGKYLIQHIDIISYTSATIINPNRVNYNTNINDMPSSLEILLRDDSFTMNLLMTDPLSKAAYEAFSSQKLGNANWEGNSNATTSAFEDAYQKIIDAYHSNGLFADRLKDGHINVHITNIALPYAIMKVDYKENYRELNYIKVDLYSPYMERNNKNRRSFIISEEKDKDNYNFFAGQVDKIINGHNTRNIKIFNDDFIKHKVNIIKKSEMETAFRNKSRQYFSGKVAFGRGNLPNKISFIETGLSNYGKSKDVYVDVPHFHFTTAEHYLILKGEQKIIDLNNNKQITAQAGDFVFIPPFTKHATKNKPGTKIFFVKSPEAIAGEENNADKCEIDRKSLEKKINILEWSESYETDLKTL